MAAPAYARLWGASEVAPSAPQRLIAAVFQASFGPAGPETGRRYMTHLLGAADARMRGSATAQNYAIGYNLYCDLCNASNISIHPSLSSAVDNLQRSASRCSSSTASHKEHAHERLHRRHHR